MRSSGHYFFTEFAHTEYSSSPCHGFAQLSKQQCTTITRDYLAQKDEKMSFEICVSLLFSNKKWLKFVSCDFSLACMLLGIQLSDRLTKTDKTFEINLHKFVLFYTE